jgi:hypothetical protein
MPLPNPTSSESRTDFVARCVIDFNVRNDFETIEQRIAVCNSLYEQEKEIKSAEENFNKSFDRLLDKEEKKQAKLFYSYYQSEYEKGIKMFIQQGSLNSGDVQAFFKLNDWERLYKELYTQVGMTFATWYAKNFKKFVQKQLDLDVQGSIWKQAFAFFGGQVAARRVTLVSGTAKNTLIAICSKLMRDPDFMRKGNEEKARIMRSQFKRYSDYQAKRVVRTEMASASNYATLRSANDIFGADQMVKKWSTRLDGKERPAHQSANGQTVEFNGSFEVGGEKMAFPGSGSIASNNINCRCKSVPLPKPNAQAIGEIIGIGYGLQGANIGRAITAEIANQVIASTIVNETLKD